MVDVWLLLLASQTVLHALPFPCNVILHVKQNLWCNSQLCKSVEIIKNGKLFQLSKTVDNNCLNG